MTHHYYFYDPVKVNLDAMRMVAIEHTRPGNRFSVLPETGVVHMHAKQDSCIGVEHEIVKPSDTEEKGYLVIKYTPTQEDVNLKEQSNDA